MKAAFYETTGGPEVIRVGELPTPVPAAGQVRVRVRAASVNPIDTYLRSGAIAMEKPTPTIPGCDLAGEVDAVGPGVTALKVGDRVWGSNQGLLGRQGTFAEFVVTDPQWLYPLPEGVTFESAAAFALVGITAHLGLFHRAGLKAGETLFVNGGTGGVGSMVVQMGKAVGATVITTVGSDEKADLARALGADQVIRYKSESVPDAVKKAAEPTGGVQVWYETQREPDFLTTVPLLAPRGRMVIMAGREAKPVFPAGPFYVKGCSLFGFAMFAMTPEEQRRCADDINRWAASGALRVHVGLTLPLERAAEAHRVQEAATLQKSGGLTGKIVVAMYG